MPFTSKRREQPDAGLPLRSQPQPKVRTGFALSVLLAWMISGCGNPTGAPRSDDAAPAINASESAGKHSSNEGEASGVDTHTSSPGKLLETWDAVYMKDSKIGTIHTVLESVRHDNQTMIRGTSLQELKIPRAGEETRMQIRLESLETEEGAIRSFTAEVMLGPTPLVTRGTYRAGALHLTTSGQGQQRQRTIPWDDSRGGFFTLERSLREQPMEPGEERELTMLMPAVSGIQTVTTMLRAEALETVDLLDGPKKLLRIAVKSLLGGEEIDSVCWTSPRGDVLKTSLPGMQHTVYRTTKDHAQKPDSGDYDLFWDSIVPVATPLPRPHDSTRAVYEVSLPQKKPSEIFVSGSSQRVRPLDQNTARLTVLAVRPESQLSGAADPEPGPDDVAPNSLIQADDPHIVRMARQLVDDNTDPWSKSVALEKGVHQLIASKNFGQGFATAADVARSLEGDCTEHAVLLAALCRAEGIPARVALGLVYSPNNQGFAFHMWNEAWIQDRWIPLDATLGQGGIGAAHLKLRHSNLANEMAESAILSVVQVIHQLQIQVVEVEVEGPESRKPD